MTQIPFQFPRDIEEDFDFDAEIIRRNHLQVEMRQGAHASLERADGIISPDSHVSAPRRKRL